MRRWLECLRFDFVVDATEQRFEFAMLLLGEDCEIDALAEMRLIDGSTITSAIVAPERWFMDTWDICLRLTEGW
jgi:hypothetical protein